MSNLPDRSPEQRRQEQRRRVYLRHRIPMIRDEMKQVVQESKGLLEKLKNRSSDQKATDTRQTRERLIYLGEHQNALKAQLQALMAEHKDLPMLERQPRTEPD
ncbi:MAG: hypothetical protein JO056_09920 [Alphaproteobacteria bacterium]|nr:hypothetical protein [Alphaproteobacteria bacterium]